jgi:hypothetical protein
VLGRVILWRFEVAQICGGGRFYFQKAVIRFRVSVVGGLAQFYFVRFVHGVSVEEVTFVIDGVGVHDIGCVKEGPGEGEGAAVGAATTEGFNEYAGLF